MGRLWSIINLPIPEFLSMDWRIHGFRSNTYELTGTGKLGVKL